jgi:hypothetical protein
MKARLRGSVVTNRFVRPNCAGNFEFQVIAIICRFFKFRYLLPELLIWTKIDLTPDRNQWGALVNTVMNLRVP